MHRKVLGGAAFALCGVVGSLILTLSARCCAECHAIRPESGAAHAAAKVHATACATHGCATAAHICPCHYPCDCLDDCLHVAASHAVSFGMIQFTKIADAHLLRIYIRTSWSLRMYHTELEY